MSSSIRAGYEAEQTPRNERAYARPAEQGQHRADLERCARGNDQMLPVNEAKAAGERFYDDRKERLAFEIGAQWQREKHRADLERCIKAARNMFEAAHSYEVNGQAFAHALRRELDLTADAEQGLHAPTVEVCVVWLRGQGLSTSADKMRRALLPQPKGGE
jgi:hypothetical protein